MVAYKVAAQYIHNVWLSTKIIPNVWLLYSLYVYNMYMASQLWLRCQSGGGARRLRQIILPSFLSYYPRPSLSPPFDLRIFPFPAR